MQIPTFIHRNNLVLLALSALAAVTLSYLFYGRAGSIKVKQEHVSPSRSVVPLIKKVDTISISIVGDMMVGSNYPSPALLPPDSVGNILQYTIPLLRTTDLRIGNLESAISDTASLFKDCTGPQCYAFRTPYKYARWYKIAGFNYLNLANNHSFDFGMAGVENTLEFLKMNNIRTSGIEQHPFDTITVRNTRIGFVSFAPHTNCLDLNDDSLVRAYIAQVRPICNILIVFFHGGAEGATHALTPRSHELFLGQDRGDVRHFAHMCIDAGADFVIGSGPHVVRGMETYKEKLIAYSLGNFATYHQFNLKFPNNVASLQQIRITRQGVITENKIYSFKQEGEGIPVLDTVNNAYKLIRSLSVEDFGFRNVSLGL